MPLPPRDDQRVEEEGRGDIERALCSPSPSLSRWGAEIRADPSTPAVGRPRAQPPRTPRPLARSPTLRSLRVGADSRRRFHTAGMEAGSSALSGTGVVRDAREAPLALPRPPFRSREVS